MLSPEAGGKPGPSRDLLPADAQGCGQGQRPLCCPSVHAPPWLGSVARPVGSSPSLFIRCLQGIKKPYNPILGETFRCCWFHPQTNSHTFYIAEQARPPAAPGDAGLGSGWDPSREQGWIDLISSVLYW